MTPQLYPQSITLLTRMCNFLFNVWKKCITIFISKEDREREIYLLVHSPNACHRQEPGTQSENMGGRNLNTWSITCSLPGCSLSRSWIWVEVSLPGWLQTNQFHNTQLPHVLCPKNDFPRFPKAYPSPSFHCGASPKVWATPEPWVQTHSASCTSLTYAH